MKILWLIIFAVLLTACTQKMALNIEVDEVTLITSDGLKLAGVFYPGKLDKGVVLLHQLGLDKSSWESFVLELNKANYYVLALDLRGHGESEGELTDEQFLNMILDAKAGHEFLKNAAITKIAIVGSSIGANTALKYGADNKLPIVALSPGLDYKGIKTEEAAQKIKKALIISTEGDSYSFESINKLKELNENIMLKTYGGNSHGTNIFKEENNLGEDIISWLDENI